MTFMMTEGWLYLTVALDWHSRKIVLWSIGSRTTADLPLTALRMAFDRRHPAPGLMHHSDSGSQHVSEVYQQALQGMQMTCSMSRKGDRFDATVVESFFASFRREKCGGESYLSPGSMFLSIWNSCTTENGATPTRDTSVLPNLKLITPQA